MIARGAGESGDGGEVSVAKKGQHTRCLWQ